MVESKYLCLFLGGVAVGGVGTALIWRYSTSRGGDAILKEIGNADCWPLRNVKCYNQHKIHVISDRADLEIMTSTILNQVNLVRVKYSQCLQLHNN